MEIVELLLRNGVDVNAKNAFGWEAFGEKPLLMAVRGGHREIVEFLLLNGADANGRHYSNDPTPLLDVITRDLVPLQQRLEIAETLLQHGALLSEEQITTIETTYNPAILTYATFFRHPDKAITLLQAIGIDIDSVGQININNLDRFQMGGVQALVFAAKKGHREIVEAIAQAGVNINAPTEEQHATAFIMAAAEGHTEVVKLIISLKGSALAVDVLGGTALIYATKGGHADTVNIILESLTNVDEEIRRNLETIMRYAKLGIASYIAQAATLNANIDAANIDEFINSIRAAHINHVDEDGLTAVIYAAINKGSAKIIEALAQAGANVDATRRGIPPLAYAILYGNIEAIDALLKAGADVEAVTETCLNNVAASAANAANFDKSLIHAASQLDLRLFNRLMAVGYGHHIDIALKVALVALMPGHDAVRALAEDFTDEKQSQISRLRELYNEVRLQLEQGHQNDPVYLADSERLARATVLAFATDPERAQLSSDVINLSLIAKRNSTMPNRAKTIISGYESSENTASKLSVSQRQALNQALANIFEQQRPATAIQAGAATRLGEQKESEMTRV
jgi:ankyrin repeat protein